jgi:hypothetical protein
MVLSQKYCVLLEQIGTYWSTSARSASINFHVKSLKYEFSVNRIITVISLQMSTKKFLGRLGKSYMQMYAFERLPKVIV